MPAASNSAAWARMVSTPSYDSTRRENSYSLKSLHVAQRGGRSLIVVCRAGHVRCLLSREPLPPGDVASIAALVVRDRERTGLADAWLLMIICGQTERLSAPRFNARGATNGRDTSRSRGDILGPPIAS
eukprot:scaffold297251_cov26-Tisochrysis_lutea.AAC.2